MLRYVPALLLVALIGVVSACQGPRLRGGDSSSTTFQIAKIPDTQDYVDYTHQDAEGFAFDASDQFIEQMAWIAE